MGKTVGIGHQDFEQVIKDNIFYIDKTDFIREWWESKDVVTLITRPRRFGKTLNLSMLNCFFSIKYSGRGELFEGLSIWKDEKYHMLQGSYPVIFISFASVKEVNYENAKKRICQIIAGEYSRCTFLLDGDFMTEQEKNMFREKTAKIDEEDAAIALNQISEYLYKYYGRKVIILLDEYDTPMQEAYINGYWDEMAGFTRTLFNCTFKTNPYLGRAIMTGITIIGKESIFSDLNNLEVVTTTSNMYSTAFGFTEEEVFAAMDEFGIPQKKEAKYWYDGFTFGKCKDIYNQWSIINFLREKRFATYWADTGSNSLAGKLVREGSPEIKMVMGDLLQGKPFHTTIDEQIVQV